MKYYSRVLTLLSIFVAYSCATCLAFGAHKESQPFVAVSSEYDVQRVSITVDSYSFDPNHIIVTVNKPVELTLKSVTKIVPHNFTLKDSDAGLNVDQNISPGKEVKVSFTPTKTGNFQFYCDKKSIFANHRKKGMEGMLEVKE